MANLGGVGLVRPFQLERNSQREVWEYEAERRTKSLTPWLIFDILMGAVEMFCVVK